MMCSMICCSGLFRKYPTNYILLFVFTIFEAVLVGFVSAMYTAGSVALCAGITALIFLALTVYAWTTKTDFTGLGPYLFGAMMAFMMFGFMMCLMSMFGFYMPHMMMLYNFCGVM